MKPRAHIVRVPSDTDRAPSTSLSLPEKVDFPYSKKLFQLRLILQTIMIALVGMAVSPLFLDAPLPWAAAILAILIAYLLISAVTPFLTSHTLTSEELILRQGLYFRTRIPFDEIESVEETSEFIMTGVKFSITGRKIYVAGSKRGLVRITLKRGRRFFLALGKLAQEIIIDVKNRPRFIGLLSEILESRQALIPSSPDQSSLLQS